MHKGKNGKIHKAKPQNIFYNGTVYLPFKISFNFKTWKTEKKEKKKQLL